MCSSDLGTIEPNAMAAEAVARLQAAGVENPGSRFIAITDEGTALHRKAVAEGFRDIFINPSDIGGRFSALSLFGVVPAALMGADLQTFLRQAAQMAEACRRAESSNPGVQLGAFMAAAARSGRDKLTLLLPPALASLGLWIEQLVAESTGKDGVGVVPIAGEDARRSGLERFYNLRASEEVCPKHRNVHRETPVAAAITTCDGVVLFPFSIPGRGPAGFRPRSFSGHAACQPHGQVSKTRPAWGSTTAACQSGRRNWTVRSR